MQIQDTSAFTALQEIASAGPKAFVNEDLYDNHPHPRDPYGTGYDLEIPVTVEFGDLSVPCTIRFRLARKLDDGLHVRTRLEWESSVGRHVSYAAYTIDPDRTVSCRWEQTFPGSSRYAAFETRIFSMETKASADRATAEHERGHHRTVIRTLQDSPLIGDLLCMLSNTDVGSIHPDELARMHTWLNARDLRPFVEVERR